MSERTRSLCGFETTDISVADPDRARIGYLSIRPPLSRTYQQTPRTYKSGLNARGQIIGRNATVPYPGELPKYHDIPFLRNKEWAGHSHNIANFIPDASDVTTCTGDTYQNTLGSSELDEYFTADNDEGYRKWAEKKLLTCGEEVKEALEEKHREKVRECMENKSVDTVNVSNPDSESFFHYMPSNLTTTNQTYGSYIDLAGNYPTVKKLKPKDSNTSASQTASLPLVDTSHQYEMKIARMLGLEQRKSSKTSNLVFFNQPEMLHMLGQRDKCNTFPAHSPTGLEMNRIPSSNRSLFATLAQQQLNTRPSHISLATIPFVQKLRTTTPYFSQTTRTSRGPTKSQAYVYIETKSFGI